MSKTSLTQITFDFVAENENEVKAAEKEMLTASTEVAEVTEEIPVQEEILSESRGKIEPAELKRKSTRGRLALKEIHLNADLIQIPPDEILFQKQYLPQNRQ